VWLRSSLYALFSLFAAPFEAWSFYFNGIGASKPEFLNYPWSKGLLYAVAIVLVAESIFRMVHHWEVTKKNMFMQFLLFLAVLLEFGMVFFYLMAERIRIIGRQPLVDSTGVIQNWLVLVALLIAWISFIVLERADHKAAPSKE
jgi:protein-S-isoprenylcysteine O-methyltransferase Ste14